MAAILTDNLFFVVVSAGKEWLETTLVRREDAIAVDSASGSVKVISWSRKHDRHFRLTRVSNAQRNTEMKGYSYLLFVMAAPGYFFMS